MNKLFTLFTYILDGSNFTESICGESEARNRFVQTMRCDNVTRIDMVDTSTGEIMATAENQQVTYISDWGEFKIRS